MQKLNGIRPFVSCDWGTSHFRLRLLGLATPREIRTDDGAAKLAAADGDRAENFRVTLARGLEKLQAPAELPIFISGMASSSIGWKELPYARLPFALDGGNAVWEQMDDRTFLISGLRSDTDILRGEETEALGLASTLGPDFPSKAVLILPGTHSKHLEVDGASVTGFRTHMTGELFALLSRQSVLRHSTDPTAPFDVTAFIEGVEEAKRQPLPAALFRVRTRHVLDRQMAASNTSFLSGLLIATELAALTRSDRRVIVASGESLRRPYISAAEALGLGARLLSVDAEMLASVGQVVLMERILPGK
ncbi:MAG TPA: 2-dehydro-3-deoxygalactonokinase [Verrucomicrobiae bacterium]|nr:2-dehydro-3-deoxygalactonokinase [Verrucomicrobiae bacterium]